MLMFNTPETKHFNKPGPCSLLLNSRNVTRFFSYPVLPPHRRHPFERTVTISNPIADFQSPLLVETPHTPAMAESIPAQPAAEQSVFDSVAAPVKSMVSESVSETRSSSTSTQTHGIPPPSEVPVTDRPLVVKDMASQATPTEPVNGPTQTVDDTSLPPPVQTSTGEPNGTNGINGAAPVSPDDDEETPLFSQSLISPEVAALLPEGYSMRPLRRSDYHKGIDSP